ncbi:cytochrome P450 [Paenibacillus sp. CC-CFT747]|nr:cytochrome P450 [Paenibacillus sp. CC-CFT747]
MLNLFSPEMLRNPYPMYEAVRSAQPVMYVEPLQLWSVFRYDDVKMVLSDHARFSSGPGGPPAAAGGPPNGDGFSLVTTDPPRHTDLRSLVNRAFTPKAVAALEPRIEQITHELLDQVSGTGQIDLVHDFTYPLPVIVIAELLGVPSNDRDRFKEWSDEVVASADAVIGGSHDKGKQANDEMNEYFRGIIAERRKAPREDLISSLIAVEEGAFRLSETDILSFCRLLLVAGNETTTNLIGNAVLSLLENPGEQEKLRSNPDMLASTIEEVLRFRSPFKPCSGPRRKT